MYPFNESAAQFPPPRVEEPANLRREIVEELADHLTCARRREQMAGGAQNEEAVRRRVLDRFGDPAAVARKLWLDWMWEKIMTQRVLVATCVLMAVVSCVALGLAWASLNRQHDMIATWQSTSETQMRDQQKLFERLLGESKAGTPSDWNPVEFRFVKGKEGGPPAAGIKVSVSIQASETGIPSMDGVSNEQGIVRFERVRYGAYTVDVRNSANESLLSRITLQPGESLTRTIVCPDPPSEPARVTLRVAWPQELADRSPWMRFQEERVRREIAGQSWMPPGPIVEEIEPGAYPGYRLQPLTSPNGEMAAASWQAFRGVAVRRGRGSYGVPSDQSSVRYGISLSLRSGEEIQGRPIGPRLIALPQGVNWPGDDYQIESLQVLIPDTPLTSLEELTKAAQSSESGRGRGGLASQRGQFNVIDFKSADWGYRIEPSANDKPGTLWLTPTDVAVERVRAALAEVDQAREAKEKARIEFEKVRAANQQQQPPVAAQEAEKKDGSG